MRGTEHPERASMQNEIPQETRAGGRPTEFDQYKHWSPCLPDGRDGLGGDPRGAWFADSFERLQAMQLSRSRRRRALELIRRVP